MKRYAILFRNYETNEIRGTDIKISGWSETVSVQRINGPNVKVTDVMKLTRRSITLSSIERAVELANKQLTTGECFIVRVGAKTCPVKFHGDRSDSRVRLHFSPK